MADKFDRREYEDLSIWHLNENEIDSYLGSLEEKNNERMSSYKKSISEEEENYYIYVQTKLYFNIRENDPRFDRFMECIRLRNGDHLAIKNFIKRLDQYSELFIRLIDTIHEMDLDLLMRFQDLYWFYTFKKGWADVPRLLKILIKSRLFFLNHIEEYMAFTGRLDKISAHRLLMTDYQNRAFLEGIDYGQMENLIDAYEEFKNLEYERFEKPTFGETAEYKLYVRNIIVSYFHDNMPLVPAQWIEKHYAPDYENALSMHAVRNGKKPEKFDRRRLTEIPLP